MTFLWFNPKRVWAEVLTVSSEKPDRYEHSDSIRIEWGPGKIPEYADTLRIYCNPSCYRFMERISRCPDCNKLDVLDNAWHHLPPWHGDDWYPRSDLITLYANSYPPFVIVDQCKWCASREDEILSQRKREQEHERLVQSLRDEFSRMTTTKIAGKLCRCTICATLFWANRLRHHKRNVCSIKCNEVLSSFIERSRRHISVMECSNDYIQHLLGGISHPALIECKRTQIQLTRVLKEKRKHDNQNQRTEPRDGAPIGTPKE